jgi:hypothetical protein
MTTAQQIESLKRSLRNMRRIAANIITEDHEEISYLNRTIRDMDDQIDELELMLDGNESTEDRLMVA